jgi:hypothetical protein
MAVNRNGELFLFDRKSRKQAVEAFDEVSIKPVNGTKIVVGGIDVGEASVIGRLTSQFSFDVDAQYDSLLDAIAGGGILGKMGAIAGVSLLQQGLFKRKFYTGSSFQQFTVEFRVVADGTHTIAQYDANNGKRMLNIKGISQYLAHLCMPGNTGEIYSNIAGVISKTGDVVQELIPIASKVAKSDLKLADGVDAFESTVTEVIKPLYEGGASINFPRTLSVKIGSYFESNDLVMEKMSVKYSKEKVSNGDPLFADYTVTLSTATINGIDTKGRANTGLDHVPPAVTLRSSIKNTLGLADEVPATTTDTEAK